MDFPEHFILKVNPIVRHFLKHQQLYTIEKGRPASTIVNKEKYHFFLSHYYLTNKNKSLIVYSIYKQSLDPLMPDFCL
jgi:hypothetical protein